ncbi:MAG: response regulator transcription factor [Chloroflexi bacterium]|nr:response regulator transcription factor [Chloroflexota bacterium]
MIRVIVVDDHPVVRQGLSAILGFESDIEVVGQAADGAEAVRLIRELRPDVVLLDLRMPKLSGVEVMREVRPALPQVRFLVVTTFDADADIGPALAAGSNGYLLKDASPEDLLRAVRSLAQGGAALQPGVAARLLERMSGGVPNEELSSRELEVLRLVVAGRSNKAIALNLRLSENTVKSHLSHIFAKLGVQSRAEAVATALQRGLVQMGGR